MQMMMKAAISAAVFHVEQFLRAVFLFFMGFWVKLNVEGWGVWCRCLFS